MGWVVEDMFHTEEQDSGFNIPVHTILVIYMHRVLYRGGPRDIPPDKFLPPLKFDNYMYAKHQYIDMNTVSLFTFREPLPNHYPTTKPKESKAHYTC